MAFGRLPQEVVDQLAACILRNKLWATPEETAEWLKTERGQLIASLIRKEEERMRKEERLEREAKAR